MRSSLAHRGSWEEPVPSTISFLIVEDHPLFQDALLSTISSSFPGAKTQTANSIDAAKRHLASEDRFDLTLLDLSMPGTRGFEGLVELRQLYPKMPIVVVSAMEEPRIIQQAIEFGAAGFIAKSSPREELAAGVREVLDGSITLPKGYSPPPVKPQSCSANDLLARISSLTPKQLAVLKMLRQGLLNKQIAHELDIEETTVKAHVSEILRKLDVASRTQAVIEVQRIDFELISDLPRASGDR